MDATGKPFLKVLRGAPAAVPPLWLMRQAGRYLPEYRALRTQARDFIDFCLRPELAVEATLQPIRRYGMDAAILFADILLIPHAMGQSVRFVEGDGPQLVPLRSAEDLARLSTDAVPELLAPVCDTVRGVRAALPPEAALIGFAGAPWTVATYMVEGKGGTEQGNIRRMAWSNPALFAALMDRLVEATAAYLIAQAEAGAEALQIFDTWAGNVPGPLFDAAVTGPTARIVRAVKAKFPALPVIGFPRAAGVHLARYAKATGVDAVGVDHMNDIRGASDAVGPSVAVQGNLDPMLLLEGGPAMDAEVRRQVAAMQGRRYIFNLGHGVTPPTPPDHVARVVELVRGG
ncbi:MAG: uroporphyrinogen decarboxylase [Alphaproteobacteria bacterium]|nr:uroporphyrinogen decarboxylase [Alphaproteobacteria bacterium]